MRPGAKHTRSIFCRHNGEAPFHQGALGGAILDAGKRLVSLASGRRRVRRLPRAQLGGCNACGGDLGGVVIWKEFRTAPKGNPTPLIALMFAGCSLRRSHVMGVAVPRTPIASLPICCYGRRYQRRPDRFYCVMIKSVFVAVGMPAAGDSSILPVTNFEVSIERGIAAASFQPQRMALAEARHWSTTGQW